MSSLENFSFLWYDDGNEEKIVSFSSPSTKEKIKSITTFYGDGTIRATPKQFYQIYTLHTDSTQLKDICFVPLLVYVFSLLKE